MILFSERWLGDHVLFASDHTNRPHMVPRDLYSFVPDFSAFIKDVYCQELMSGRRFWCSLVSAIHHVRCACVGMMVHTFGMFLAGKISHLFAENSVERVANGCIPIKFSNARCDGS